MRWSFSSAAWICLTLGACVTTTTAKYYVPTEGQERISQHQLRERLDALLRVECPRLMGQARSAMADAEFTLEVDASGEVARASLDRGTGDARVDDIFGGLVAELRFDPPASASPVARARLTVGYSCSPTAAVSTVELTP